MRKCVAKVAPEKAGVEKLGVVYAVEESFRAVLLLVSYLLILVKCAFSLYTPSSYGQVPQTSS